MEEIEAGEEEKDIDKINSIDEMEDMHEIYVEDRVF